MSATVASVLVAMIGLLAACGPSEPSVGIIAIATQSAQPPGQESCEMALLEGTLALDPRTGLGVEAADGSTVWRVRWPNGWRALDTAPVALADADGKIVARVGDHISMGGGFGNDDVFFACPVGITAG
jgi:hypothetical protein